MIVPLFVSVPLEMTSVALLPELSPFVSVIVPAFVKLAAAVASAFSPLVLSTDSDCAAQMLPLSLLRAARSDRAGARAGVVERAVVEDHRLGAARRSGALGERGARAFHEHRARAGAGVDVAAGAVDDALAGVVTQRRRHGEVDRAFVGQRHLEPLDSVFVLICSVPVFLRLPVSVRAAAVRGFGRDRAAVGERAPPASRCCPSRRRWSASRSRRW